MIVVWQKPTHCKAIILQLNKHNERQIILENNSNTTSNKEAYENKSLIRVGRAFNLIYSTLYLKSFCFSPYCRYNIMQSNIMGYKPLETVFLFLKLIIKLGNIFPDIIIIMFYIKNKFLIFAFSLFSPQDA